MTICKNCETTFEGKYCSNCAQKADTHRFTIKHFLHESFHALTHTDKGIFFLIKELFLRPGYAIREFVEGKRKKYFNPITFLLIASALQLFAMQKTEIMQHNNKSLQEFAKKMNELKQKQSGEQVAPGEVDDQNEKTTTTMLEKNKMLTLLIIPFIGLLTWLMFRKSGLNYAENLVMNVLISGELSILFLVFCIIPFLLFPSLVILWILLFGLLNWVYSIIVYKQFYKQGWAVTIMKGIVLQVMTMVVVHYLTKGLGALSA